ncbi:hypothetical protein [Nocardioides aequoreus]|uniref:hypothetical protein n=1 Tax=Nocardioides aequoreus TaxID=397278 RepID=UPI0004C3FA73|nr:hypothetical protein [Nocardioides aequoreus]
MTEPHPDHLQGQPEGQPRSPAHSLWVKVVAAVVAVALVFGAGFVAFTVLTGEPERDISLPDTVAGMSRDAALEQRASGELDTAAQQFASLFDGQARAQLGIYDQADEERGPTGPVNVVGVDIEGETDPQQLLDQAASTAERNGLQVERVGAGEGAQGLCASQDTGTQLCIWATTTSFGQVFTTTEGWTVDQLRSLMTAVRGDVETVD